MKHIAFLLLTIIYTLVGIPFFLLVWCVIHIGYMVWNLKFKIVEQFSEVFSVEFHISGRKYYIYKSIIHWWLIKYNLINADKYRVIKTKWAI